MAGLEIGDGILFPALAYILFVLLTMFFEGCCLTPRSADMHVHLFAVREQEARVARGALSGSRG